MSPMANFFPLRFYKISRVLFSVVLIIQAIFLTQFVVNHEENPNYFGLSALFALSLFYWFGVINRDDLRDRLGTVWFGYSLSLLILIGVIFGLIVIKGNKLRSEAKTCSINQPNISEINCSRCINISAFDNVTQDTENAITKQVDVNKEKKSFLLAKILDFGPNVLILTLSLTPVQMLLLLTSVADEAEILEEPAYFATPLNLFDGVEMLEILLQEGHEKITIGWEIIVVTAVCLYYLLSFLELVTLTKLNNETGQQELKKKTTACYFFFQAFLNVAFMVIRCVLWRKYKMAAAIFLVKNAIVVGILLVSILEFADLITWKCDEKNDAKNDKESVNR